MSDAPPVVNNGPTLEVPSQTSEEAHSSGSVDGGSVSDAGGESTLPTNDSENLNYFDAHSEMCKYYHAITLVVYASGGYG